MTRNGEVGLGQDHVDIGQQDAEEWPFRFMRRSSIDPLVGFMLQKLCDRGAKAKPAGKATRAWPQEKLQGIARKSSIRREGLREAGREPIFSEAISAIGVEAKK